MPCPCPCCCGACYTDEGCSVTTSAQCQAAGGEWQGFGTTCDPLGVCCGWSCDFLGDILWPEDWYDPESPNYENYLSIPPPEGWLAGGYWVKVVEGVANCNEDPDVIAAIKAELEAELNAYVVPLGGVVGQILLDPDSSGQGCFNATEQECADTLAGTWYESQEECWGNCPNPLP